MENRITDLEYKQAFLEKTVSDLDLALREISADVEIMKRELKRLREQGPEQGLAAPANERPPHY